MSLSDWTAREQDLGNIIIEMFKEKDSSGFMWFRPKDLRGYYNLLEKNWGKTNHNIDDAVRMYLRHHLEDKLGVITRRAKLGLVRIGKYRLVKEGVLYRLLMEQVNIP